MPPWTALLVLPFFYTGIVVLISRMGGWHDLARGYAATYEPQGPYAPIRSLRVGMASYRNCVRVKLAPEGLYLVPMSVFRWGHPALLLPWRELKLRKIGKAMGFRWAELQVGDPAVTTLKVAMPALELLKPYLPPAELSRLDAPGFVPPPAGWLACVFWSALAGFTMWGLVTCTRAGQRPFPWAGAVVMGVWTAAVLLYSFRQAP